VILHKNLAVLEVADVGLLDVLRATVPLDSWIVGWLSPTEAILDPARLREALDALEAAGMAALVRRDAN
jgi:hypothetical protein